MNVSIPLPQRSRTSRRKAARASTAIVVSSQGPQAISQPKSNQQVTVRTRPRRRRNRRRARRNGAKSPGGSNQYLATLVSPWKNRGIKVPDNVTFPSSTFSVEQEKTFIVDANCICGLFVLYPWNSNDSTATGTTSQTWMNPMQHVFGPSTGNFTGSVNLYKSNFANASTISTLYDSIRPVSAGIQIYSTGSSTLDGGEVSVGIYPREVTPMLTSVVTYDAANNSAYSKNVPFKEGAYVTWKPMDNRDMEYIQSDINVIPGNAGAQVDEYLPAIYCAWNALSVGATIKVKVVVNFEGVAAIDVMNMVGSSYSAHNPGMLDRALQWASNAYANMGKIYDTIGPYVQPVATQFARRALENQAQRYLTV